MLEELALKTQLSMLSSQCTRDANNNVKWGWKLLLWNPLLSCISKNMSSPEEFTWRWEWDCPAQRYSQCMQVSIKPFVFMRGQSLARGAMSFYLPLGCCLLLLIRAPASTGISWYSQCKHFLTITYKMAVASPRPYLCFFVQCCDCVNCLA